MIFKKLYTQFLDFKREYERTQFKSSTKLNSIRIYLTEKCNATCSHCFNKDIRDNQHMDYNIAIKLFKYLHKNNVKVLKMMGGEPTIHPDFIKLYSISQSYFSGVKLFTNGLNEMLFSIKPRNNDAIIYNFIFINSKFNFDKMLPQFGDLFPRVFEIVVDSKTDIENLLARINLAHQECVKKRNINNIYFQLTLNCICNIFEHKTEINHNFRNIAQHIITKYPNKLSFDHGIPYCFWEDETLLFMIKNDLDYYQKTCTGKDVGLIDSKFNLSHCNQHPTKLSSILKDGHFISFNEMINILLKENQNKKAYNAKKICSQCEFFDVKCTGGCMMHKDFVKPLLV